MLTILAWYTLIFISLSGAVTVVDNKQPGLIRLASLICVIPIIIFAILTLIN